MDDASVARSRKCCVEKMVFIGFFARAWRLQRWRAGGVMKISLGALFAAVTLLAATSGSAQNVITTQRASASAITCTPMSTTSTVPPWSQTHGKVYHRGTAVEPITLFCPVHFEFMTVYTGQVFGGFYKPTLLTIKYIDPDASGSQAQVEASLKWVDSAGGVHVVGSLDSNLQGAGNGVKTMSLDVDAHEFNATQYYVQLSIKRSNTGLIPAVYGFDLH
jgi:hypothetical protein